MGFPVRLVSLFDLPEKYGNSPNHGDLIAVPETKDGLKVATGEIPRRYPRRLNFRKVIGGAPHIYNFKKFWFSTKGTESVYANLPYFLRFKSYRHK
jgi:hypothetical protein